MLKSKFSIKSFNIDAIFASPFNLTFFLKSFNPISKEGKASKEIYTSKSTGSSS